MTWREWMAARQLLAEEVIGVPIRAKDREEDARFQRSVQNLQRIK